MVKSKGGRSMNPADAHRKAQRKKELKKNKVERKKVREVAMAVKDTTKLEAEIIKYEELAKEKRLDKNGHAKLTQLKEQLEKIIKTKEAHKIPLNKAAPKQPPKLVNPDDPESSPYYHPTLNPLGLAPSQARQAGYQVPHAHKDEENGEDESDESMGSNASGGEQDDNNHDEDEEFPELPPGSPPIKPAEMADEEDDELPELPPGTPPKKESESQDGGDDDDEDDDDMIELPPGPPPARPLEQGSFPPPLFPPAGYAQYSGIPPPPPMRPGYYPPAMLGGLPPFARLDMRGLQIAPGVPQSFASRPPPPPPRPPQHYAPNQVPRLPNGPHPRPPYTHYGPPAGRPYRLDYSNPDGAYAPPPPSAPPAPGVSAELTPLPPRPPAPVITAAPQVRDLRKELTTLVPASVLRKKFAAEKAGGTGKVTRPKINAAPDLDTETDERGTSTATTLAPAVSVPGPVVQGVKATMPGPAASVPGAGAAKGNREKTTDEYAKFMKEMEGLL